jgi:hypothetical protein
VHEPDPAQGVRGLHRLRSVLDRYGSDLQNVFVALVTGGLVWLVAEAIGLTRAPVVGVAVGLLGLMALEIRLRRGKQSAHLDLRVDPVNYEMQRLQIQGRAALNREIEIFRVGPLRVTNRSRTDRVSLKFELRVTSVNGVVATLPTDSLASVVRIYAPQVTWWNLPSWASATPLPLLNVGCHETGHTEACFAWVHNEAVEGPTYEGVRPEVIVTDHVSEQMITFPVPGGYPP